MSSSSKEEHQQSDGGTIRRLRLTSSTGFLSSSYGSLTLEIVNDNNNANAAAAAFMGGGEDIHWSRRVSPESDYVRLQRPALIPHDEEQKKKKNKGSVAAAHLNIQAGDAHTIYSIHGTTTFYSLFLVADNNQKTALLVLYQWARTRAVLAKKSWKLCLQFGFHSSSTRLYQVRIPFVTQHHSGRC
jgi:hypothetical protein